MTTHRRPYPYQLEGRDFLVPLPRALLWDEMGVGKTVQCVIAAETIAMRDYGLPWLPNVLIVGPAISREHWRREIPDWAICPPGEADIAVPVQGRDIVAINRRPSITVICSYEFATRNYKKLAQRTWDLLIVDEAHMLKNPRAQRTAAIMGNLIHSTRRSWFLTGTPCQNHLGELWVFARTLGLSELDEITFCQRYMGGGLDAGGKWEARYVRKTVEELRQQLKPIMLRRLKKDVLTELPPISQRMVRVKHDRTIDMSTHEGMEAWRGRAEELRAELQRLESNVRAFLETMGSDDESYRILAGMAVASATLRKYTGLSKVPLALEMVKAQLEADPGLKLVLMCAHIEVGAWLTAELASYGAVRVYGGTSGKDRVIAVDRFNEVDSCRVFVGAIAACGHVINLAKSGCSRVLMVESEWVPAWNDQAIARIHRPPQALPVTAEFLVLSGSLDEAILDTLLRKSRIVGALWGEEKTTINPLAIGSEFEVRSETTGITFQ